MTTALYAIGIIAVIVVVLGVHEFGHLLTARLFGVKTLEYGIGFPPRLIAFATGNTKVSINKDTIFAIEQSETKQMPAELKAGTLVRINSIELPDGTLVARHIAIHRRKKKTKPYEPEETEYPILEHKGRIKSVDQDSIHVADMEWSLNLIFLGAFVHLYEDNTKKSRIALNTKTYWRRTVVISAGIIANLIFPIVPISIATVFHNPDQQSTVVISVTPLSPAAKAGILPGDRIVYIPETDNPSPTQVASSVRENEPNSTISIDLISIEGIRKTVELIPEYITETGNQRIGIEIEGTLTSIESNKHLRSAPARATANTANLYRQFYLEIESWTLGKKKPELTGIVGIIHDTTQVVKQSNVVGYLIVTAVLSVNIGIVNIIPIVPMDGGRLAMIAIEKIRRGREVSYSTQIKITGMGIVILGIVTVWLVVKDIARLAGI